MKIGLSEGDAVDERDLKDLRDAEGRRAKACFNFRVSVLALPVVWLSGCGGAGFHSPTIDVLGSYFPAWMVCIIIGLALTLISRLLLVALGLAAHVRPAAIVYPCLMGVFTMAVWLAFFRN